ncbi:type IV secretion system DNA-binding domain-containing protein [Luteolibacter pohnpeiensis]|uniref:Type IV secretion system DNA-binding domain-containing protein n=1 Tax=Luteolibacter pohnpeiensis TaxID=454153 RepID=A0A934VWA2_9BACT|nr:type IV secretion system DNA-binding domain-containing protein [Luteolibacter pohnpeiensis]MBK1884407.1 type IV secretion system DNA-binding domain-containing protein [Luteolibacter pohnpeiensis]
MTLLTIGGVAGFEAPEPYNWFAFLFTSIAGLAIVAWPKPRKIVLKFGPLTWTREELCRHILITGDTGSGKTTSGFQPLLVDLTRRVPDWGGLVLGVKGDEHRFIKDLLENAGRESDLIHLQVRPPDCSSKWIPENRYNLLSDRSLPWSTHAKIITDIAGSMHSGPQHSFFSTMAQVALTHAFETLEALGEPITIPRAYSLLTSTDMAKQAVKKLRRSQGIQKHLELAEFLETTFTQVRGHEQKEGIEGTLKTFLSFYLNDDVAEVFCSEKPNTFSFSHLDRGSILSVTMPQSLATERRYIQTYLKILFYTHVLRRYDLSPEERNNSNLLLLVADEFQDVVTTSEDGMSDHKVIDRIRSAGACIMGGMQSEISGDPAITEKKRKVLTLNMRTRLIFCAADHEGATASAEFIGKHKIWKRSISSRGIGSRSVSRHQEMEYRIHPSNLMKLSSHTAMIVHPSKRLVRRRIPPVDGSGRVYPWW